MEKLKFLVQNKVMEGCFRSKACSTKKILLSGDSYKVSSEMGVVIMILCFIFPPLWFILSLPFHRFSKIPTLKFICHCISHLYFIIVLSLVIVVPWDRSYLEVSVCFVFNVQKMILPFEISLVNVNDFSACLY